MAKQLKLSQSTIDRRESLLNKAVNSNKTFDELSKLNKQDYKKALNITKKLTNASWNSQKRLMNSIKKTPELYTKEHVKKRGGSNIRINSAISKEANRIITKPKPKISKPKIKRLKTGQYNITKVIDGNGNDRYIVWSNRAEWIKRLAKIKKDYGVLEVKGTRTHDYEPFETPKAKIEREKLGIKLS